MTKPDGSKVDAHLDEDFHMLGNPAGRVMTTTMTTIDGERNSMMTLNGFAVWTGLLCTLLAFAALPMALFAAGSGRPGWATVAAAALLSSVGVGVGVIAAVVHHDHRHHRDTPHLF